jgi:hypothetical protein
MNNSNEVNGIMARNSRVIAPQHTECLQTAIRHKINGLD